MSFSTQRTAAAALVALAALGVMATPAPAQRISPLLTPQIVPYRVNTNAYIAPGLTAQQYLYNSAVIGRGIRNIPPWALGYNPYPSPVVNYGPVMPYYPPPSYGVSTVPGTPGASPSLSTSPYSAYSLSTTPSYGGADPGMSGYGGSGGYGGYGGPPGFGPGGSGYGMGQALQGAASYTVAQGQYWKTIQEARLVREQSRQMAIDTARKQIQFEAWYESVRPTAPRMREAEAATELDRARKDPPATEVWSGKSLNELLRSVQKAIGQTGEKLSRGPQIEVTDDMKTHLNLTDKSSQGNAGLLKMADREGKLALHWPAGLEGADFQEARQRLTQNLREAVDVLRKGNRPPATTMKDIQADYKSLSDKLGNSADELSPSQWIEANRYLKQLDQAIRVLRDPKAANYFNDTWKARGNTVSAMIQNMTKDGLEFAPATPGDEAAYTAMYQALRAYENGLQVALNQK